MVNDLNWLVFDHDELVDAIAELSWETEKRRALLAGAGARGCVAGLHVRVSIAYGIKMVLVRTYDGLRRIGVVSHDWIRHELPACVLWLAGERSKREEVVCCRPPS